MMIRKTGGFTLVEVVVAITILSLIVLGTLTALRTFGRTQERLDEVSSRTQSVRQVSGFLRRILTDAQPLQRFDPERGANIYFYGDERQLVWVAPFSASRHIGGLTVFRLVADDESLTLGFAPYLGSQEPQWSEYPTYTLLEALNGFELAYRQAPGEEWLSDWREPGAMPDSLRLTIVADGRYWPDLIVRFNDAQMPTQ